MASARKKQDEKNLKIVRELVSLPLNKFCFDCNQRGPTYVNVTIGSFVCTKCSGLLRGLTPPHRVKSISMTTFTIEEVDLMRLRGNEYCRRVWLGLYDGKLAADGNGAAWDEHAVHQLMLDKYERKRFYMEPSATSTIANNVSAASVVQHNNQVNNMLYSEKNPQQTTVTKTILRPPPMQQPHNNNNNLNNIILRNGLSHAHRNRTTSSSSVSQQQQQQHLNNGDFVADFDHADIFSSNNNATLNGSAYNHGTSNGNGVETGFANFDNNPAFKNASNTSSLDDFSIFDLQFSSNWGPMWNETPLFPKVNLTNKSSFPFAASSNGFTKHTGTPPPPQPPPVAEDKYAALKDLDDSLHQSSNNTQQQPTTGVTAIDWGGSTSSLYSSATSPLSSSYGSPTTAPHFNPFNTNGFHNTNGSHPQNNDMWGNSAFDQHVAVISKQQQHQQSFFPPSSAVGTSLLNGHQPSLFGVVANINANGVASAAPANPFGVSSSNGGFVASFPPLNSTVSSTSVISNGTSGHMANGGNAALNNASWNSQNPFKLASNGSTQNPFL